MKRIPWVLIGWAGSLAVAPIVWWLVGDLSESLGDERAWAAPDWLVENTHILGVYGVVAIAAAFALEMLGVRLRVIDRQTVSVFLPLIAAAAIFACGYRVTTSFTNDTELRTAIALGAGIPIVVALAGIHIGWLRADLRRLRGF